MHRDDGVNDVPASAIEASINLFVYYQEMIADRRKKPSDDLTSALLEAEIDGDRLTDEEVLGFLFLMVIAGNETTTKLLANAAFWGHKNPDQLTPVYDDLERIPLWVEETLRYDTSSQLLARIVEGELNLYDTMIPDGDILLLLPGSGHRDERVFENPDDFIIGREIGSNLLSFGSGAHFCLGAHLARMEARVALAELFKRIQGYEVDEANAVRVHSSSVRGFAHLPMTLEVLKVYTCHALNPFPSADPRWLRAHPQVSAPRRRSSLPPMAFRLRSAPAAWRSARRSSIRSRPTVARPSPYTSTSPTRIRSTVASSE